MGTGEDEKILGEIRKATKSINKSTVETTAYLRALGESKGLKVENFRKQVEDELQDDQGNYLELYVKFYNN